MKLLRIIFGFYFLLIPALPCADKEDIPVVDTVAANIPSGQHSDHNESEEACSPFCSCVCCGLIYTPGMHPGKMTTLIPIAITKQHFRLNNFLLSSNYYGNIWQPPRIS